MCIRDSLEQALGEACPRVEIGGPSETGKEDLRPRVGFGAIGVALIAQGLERFGQPHARQRLRRLLGLARDGPFGLKYGDRLLGEIGEVTRADERVLACLLYTSP